MAAARDAHKVYCDFEIGLTKTELQSLIDNAYERMIAELKRIKEAQNARS